MPLDDSSTSSAQNMQHSSIPIQSQAVQPKKSRMGPFLFLLLWPVLVLPVLQVALLVQMVITELFVRYSNAYDASFIIGVFMIAAGHLAAFLIWPLLSARFVKGISKTKKYFALTLVVVMGPLIVAMQYWLRVLADSFYRLDCNENCVLTIMPESLGAVANTVVLFSLISAYIALICYYIVRTTKD